MWVHIGAPKKPGLIDASGALRDLSGVVPDFGPATLGRDFMSRLAAPDPATLPLQPDAPV